MWKEEQQQWARRDLSGKNFVYIWVYGVHFGVRLEDASRCILVVIGACEGRRRLVVSHVAGCWRWLFKLAKTAEQNWRTLKGHALLAQVVQGVKFKDGLQESQTRIAA